MQISPDPNVGNGSYGDYVIALGNTVNLSALLVNGQEPQFSNLTVTGTLVVDVAKPIRVRGTLQIDGMVHSWGAGSTLLNALGGGGGNGGGDGGANQGQAGAAGTKVGGGQGGKGWPFNSRGGNFFGGGEGGASGVPGGPITIYASMISGAGRINANGGGGSNGHDGTGGDQTGLGGGGGGGGNGVGGDGGPINIHYLERAGTWFADSNGGPSGTYAGVGGPGFGGGQDGMPGVLSVSNGDPGVVNQSRDLQAPAGGGMTTDQLIGMCSNYRLFREEHIPFNPDEVYPAANFVQNELCDELNLLESVCNLALVANKERYQFTPAVITDATNTTPIVITAPNHGLNTGDTALIGQVLGNLAANGKWPTVTVQDANTLSLDGSVGSGAYVSGGVIYHGLVAALSIKSIRRTLSPFGLLTWKSPEDVETDRAQMLGDSSNQSVVSYYEIFDEPIIIGIQAPPGGKIAVEARYYRRPIPLEDISPTVDPMIPFQYAKVLYLGTLYEMLDKQIRKEAQKDAKDLKEQYEEEKKRIRLILARRRMSKATAAPGLRSK